MKLNFLKSLNRFMSSFTDGNVNVGRKKIDMNNVKRVTPAQSEFKSTKDLFSYARLKCVAAIKSSSPYEYAVVADIKRNKVIAEYIGDAEKCRLDDLSQMNIDADNTAIFHGHIDGSPISPIDVRLLINFGISQIVAFDKMGRFSLVSKKDKLPMDSLKKMYNKYRFENLVETAETKNTDFPMRSLAIDAVLEKHAPLMGLRYVSSFPYTNRNHKKVYY